MKSGWTRVPSTLSDDSTLESDVDHNRYVCASPTDRSLSDVTPPAVGLSQHRHPVRTATSVNTTALQELGDAAAHATMTLAVTRTGFFPTAVASRPEWSST